MLATPEQLRDSAPPPLEPDVNTIESMFQPAPSWFSVSVCVPAGSVTVAVTVVQVCQPPVSGTATEPVKLVPEELDRWNASEIALSEATRKLTVYDPAVETLTV